MESYGPIDRLARLVGPMPPGSVSLVGAGPGDSALISVRGAARLIQADVVLHDKLVGPELLDLPRPDAERIFVGKWRGTHVWTQDEINNALVKHARAGRRVVRLKGGDPFVFGRGGEEAVQLAEAGIPFEIVPGITAAFGAPASAGIPLTHRGMSRSFVLVTGHDTDDAEHPIDFAALAQMETIAFYMGMKHLEDHCTRLIEAGMPANTPAAVIRWGTRPEQHTIVGTLGDLPARVRDENIEPPAMILIGQVVRLREKIQWFECRPLAGQRIIVTRPAEQSPALTGPLIALGAEVIEAPAIVVEPVDDPAAIDDAILNLQRYEWLVLTSGNGVNALFSRIDALGLDSRALGGVRIAAIGSATREVLLSRGVRPDLLPDEAVGESIGAALIAAGVAGHRILLLRADIARPRLVDMLREAGATCDDIAAYRTVGATTLPRGLNDRLKRGDVDWATFTSPSSFENFTALLDDAGREALRSIRIASIGPVTTQAIAAAGMTATIEADPHNADGLVEAIRTYGKGQAT